MSDDELEIRVEGPVLAGTLAEFPGLEATEEPVSTVMRGPVADDAQMHGILARLRGLGLVVLEVRRVRTPAEEGEDPDG